MYVLVYLYMGIYLMRKNTEHENGVRRRNAFMIVSTNLSAMKYFEYERMHFTEKLSSSGQI